MQLLVLKLVQKLTTGYNIKLLGPEFTYKFHHGHIGQEHCYVSNI